MSIEQDILAWDGKSTDYMSEIFQSYREESDFIDALIKLVDSSPCQKGATWLLKAWLDDGQSITNDQASKIICRLDSLEHWETKLHILQCLPSLLIKKGQKFSVEKFLRSTLPDKNKFVRAWSYNGFYELAKQHPEYRDETRQFFEIAMKDEAASVKARIRNIMKKGF